MATTNDDVRSGAKASQDPCRCPTDRKEHSAMAKMAGNLRVRNDNDRYDVMMMRLLLLLLFITIVVQ